MTTSDLVKLLQTQTELQIRGSHQFQQGRFVDFRCNQNVETSFENHNQQKCFDA